MHIQYQQGFCNLTHTYKIQEKKKLMKGRKTQCDSCHLDLVLAGLRELTQQKDFTAMDGLVQARYVTTAEGC